MSLFQSVTSIPGPQPLPSSITNVLSELPHPAPPAAPLPQAMSTSSRLFQRIQQLQAQRYTTPNPAYQHSPAPFTGIFAPAAPIAPITPVAPISASGVFAAFQPSAMYDISSANHRATTTKEEPDYYPASPAVDSEKTLREFEHFWRLPIEIIGLVVEQCALQDGVCLSLTSKGMYSLARPIMLRRDKEAYSLKRMSKYECISFLSKDGAHKPCTLRSCRNTQHYRRGHCTACTSCPLWVRLSNDNWSGLPSTQFVYCSSQITRSEWVPDRAVPPGTPTAFGGNGIVVQIPKCGKFKLKKKFHNGKCLHGGPRPKKRKVGQGGLLWTYHKRWGGWTTSGQMWKTFYTEKDLHKFQDRYMEERKSSGSTGGYNLRRKPKPTRKRVEHVNLWYGVDLENPSGRGPVEGTEGWEEEEVQKRREYNI